MSVINASQAKSGTVTATGPIGKFIHWVEGLFGTHAASTPTAHGEGDSQSPAFPNEMEFGWDKTGGWDRRKKGGWSPHGDEGGMK